MFSGGFDPGESFLLFLHLGACTSRIYMTKVINNNANRETNTMNLLKIADKETVKIYKFDELSDESKGEARDWWRNGGLDYEWHESVYSDFVNICEILGFDVIESDIHFSGFYSQGDGASFTGSYKYSKGSTKKIRKYAPQATALHEIADTLQALQKRNFYSLHASITRNHSRYVHENTISCGYVERDSDNYQDATSDAEETITDCARDLCRWLYVSLEREYEWLNSDEQVDESIRCNEYEFTFDGEIA
jgi:hypothetical protein